MNKVISWLLEPDNPSVRYFTLKELLGRGESEPDVQEARSSIRDSRPGQKIFSRQNPDGSWESSLNPYLPKYKSTYWTLMLLGYMGMTRKEPEIERAVDYIFQFQREEGGFAEFGEEWVKRTKLKAKSISDFIHQVTLSCLTGNIVSALLRFGYQDDYRIQKALNWLCAIQNPDGGWLCPYWRAHIKDRYGCFYGTICCLEAFSLYPEKLRTKKMEDVIKGGAEFLLMHRLYKADHHRFKIINKKWLCLGFPWFYSYDILRGLGVLLKLGYPEDYRIQDAIPVLLKRRTREGKWILEKTPQGRMQADLEKKGNPSKWITLYTLQVLKNRNLI